MTTINRFRQNIRSIVRESGLLNDAYSEIDVTLAERHVLIELSICASPTMGEIAERLLLDKSTVSRLISKAMKKGYVKSLTDEKDKRKRFLLLTEKGQQALAAFEQIASDQTKEALSTLTDDEIKKAYEGIALYAKGLHNSRILNKTSKSAKQQAGTACCPFESDKKPKTLAEIFEQLNRLGCVLEPFNQKDEEGLSKIFKEVVDSGHHFPNECSSVDEFRRQFIYAQGKLYTCRSLNQEAVGCFYIKPNFSGRSGHIANGGYMIQNTCRGKGIGSLLIQASLHFAKEIGCKAMQFNLVHSQNMNAVKLYIKLGFIIIGTIPEAFRNPDGSYQNGYVMHRKLDDL